MALAIVTDIGRAHELRGQRLLADFCATHRASLVGTAADQPASCDGFAVRDGKVVAVLEAKTRTGYSLYDVRRMGATVLVTEDKLVALCGLAKALGAPAFLVVEFSDGHRWFWRIAGADGRQACAWDARRTVTKSDSVGGADVTRTNAFLSLDHGVCWFAPEEQGMAIK